MKTALLCILCFVLIPTAAYLLYRLFRFLRRYCIPTVKSIAAVLFVFCPRVNGGKAVFTSCSGWVRRPVKVPESGTYEFVLDCQLLQGEVEVSLLDSKKREILRLSPYCTSNGALLTEKCRYYLRWDFKRASGKCEMHWQRQP